MAFKTIGTREIMCNPFSKIGSEWLLVTAGDAQKCNTMTASWGGLGVVWGKDAATVYIRQSRYTKSFVDANETFSLSFFDESYRSALALCGKVSGRDVDKISEAGLTPVMLDGTPAFEEARLVLVCRKLCATFLDPKDFVDPTIDETWYADCDYHTMYLASIESVHVKDEPGQ